MQRDKKHHPPNQGKHFRIEAGLTLTDIAFLLEIKNFGRISEWENGLSNPSIEHLLGLSLIYQRLEGQIYYDLRKKIAKRIEARMKLLLEIKERQRDKGG